MTDRVQKITFYKRGINHRALWVLAEKCLGGPVRMVAAYGQPESHFARYYFKLKKPGEVTHDT